MIDWLRMIEEGDALLVKITAVLRIRAAEKVLIAKEIPPYEFFCDKIGTSYHLNNMVFKEHKKCMLLILTSEEVLVGLSQPEDSSVITLSLTPLYDLHSH